MGCGVSPCARPIIPIRLSLVRTGSAAPHTQHNKASLRKVSLFWGAEIAISAEVCGTRMIPERAMSEWSEALDDDLTEEIRGSPLPTVIFIGPI